MCIYTKECRERYSTITAGEEFILIEGAYWAACKSDVSEPSSEGVISDSCAGDGLKYVDVSSDLIFIDIEGDACPCTDPLYYVEERDNIFHGVGGESAVINVPFTCTM
jgi:hypothetical protein